MLNTEKLARGENREFQNVGGGEVVYNVLTLQMSRGQDLTSGEAKAPPPLNATCYRIAENFRGRKVSVSVRNENLAEKTFTDCSGTSNYYVGVATKFSGENLRGLLRYVQLLCGCGHKI